MQATSIVEAYLGTLPQPATWERVREHFWYVRIPGQSRTWIPFELEWVERSLKVVSPFCMDPEERHGEAYAYLLTHNHRAAGIAFSVDRERTVCIVSRIDGSVLGDDALDDVIGRIVDLTETTFQSFLRLGFPRFFA